MAVAMTHLSGNLPTTGASTTIDTGVTHMVGAVVSIWSDQADRYVAWDWRQGGSTSNFHNAQWYTDNPNNDKLVIEYGSSYQGNAYQVVVFYTT